MYAAIRRQGKNHFLQLGFTTVEINDFLGHGRNTDDVRFDIEGRAELGLTLKRSSEGPKLQVAPKAIRPDYVVNFRCASYLNLLESSVRSTLLSTPATISRGVIRVPQLPKEFWLLKTTPEQKEQKAVVAQEKLEVHNLFEAVRTVNYLVDELSSKTLSISLQINEDGYLGLIVTPTGTKGGPK